MKLLAWLLHKELRYIWLTVLYFRSNEETTYNHSVVFLHKIFLSILNKTCTLTEQRGPWHGKVAQVPWHMSIDTQSHSRRSASLWTSSHRTWNLCSSTRPFTCAALESQWHQLWYTSVLEPGAAQCCCLVPPFTVMSLQWRRSLSRQAGFRHQRV